MKDASITNLSNVEAGQTVQLVGFIANGRSTLRLAELGLNPGTSITVLKSVAGQPMLILVRGTELAIDHHTARHMRVCLLGDEAPRRHAGRRGRGVGRAWRGRRRRRS